MRCFAAVDLTNDLREKIIQLQKQITGDVKLVEPENLHFTLKFFGETDDKTLEKVKVILAGISSKFRPFDAHVRGMGVFPNENHIRVIWIGCSELLELQSAVEEVFSSLFKKEPPVPHLTLARMRSKPADEIRDFVSRHKDVEIGAMRVVGIKLKKSTVTRAGPLYEDVAEFELK